MIRFGDSRNEDAFPVVRHAMLGSVEDIGIYVVEHGLDCRELLDGPIQSLGVLDEQTFHVLQEEGPGQCNLEKLNDVEDDLATRIRHSATLPLHRTGWTRKAAHVEVWRSTAANSICVVALGHVLAEVKCSEVFATSGFHHRV